MTINYKILQGQALTNYINLIAQMRIDAFNEYPYLYQGQVEIEKDYLKSYIANQKSTLVLAEDNEKIIGISTGIPLSSETSLLQECQKQLIKMDIDIEQCYYYGEIIVTKAYQNQGIASKLYTKQDAKVKTLGFDKLFILTVIRPDDHPLKPKNHNDTDTLWPHFGFKKLPITITCPWPTLQADGSVETEQNRMQLWMKKI